MGPRRALIIASCSKYAAILLQLVATFIVARNVTPDQFGITVLGGGVLLIAEAVRELGSSGYLVQQSVLTQAEVRSAFTISLIVTMTATFFILTTANWIAHFYRDDRLADYLRVMAIGYALGPFVHPISALLSRDMAFSRIAVIEIVSAGTNAATAIVLVKSGFSFMAPAWASVASGTAGMLLGFCFQGDLGIFRPSVSAWKKVLIFGIHGSATAIIYRLGEAVLFLILGRVMDARAVGLLQRAYLIAMIPERVLLAGVSAVAMPAFAEIARNKQPFKPAYLHSVELVTAIYLPGMLCLVLLAKPIVEILLGSSWTQAVPLVQIISTALLLGFPGVLNLSVLVAAGGIRQTTPLALIQMTVLVGAAALAAPFGMKWVAFTAFVTVPVSAFSSTMFVRRKIAFSWMELTNSLTKSVATALASSAGAFVVIVASDGNPRAATVVLTESILVAATGWLVGLAITRHPLFFELMRAVRRGLAFLLQR